MWSHQSIILYSILLLIGREYSSATHYRLIPENEDIFSDCLNQPANVLNINGFYDTSELTTTLDIENDVVRVSGNSTSVWDIRKDDRVEAHFQLYRFDRGDWHQTLFGMVVPNFCHELYHKTQYWFQFWTSHAINAKDIQGNCVNVPGTKFIYEPFNVDLLFDISGKILDGRYKIISTFKAFDHHNHHRTNSICFELIGEAERVH